MSENCGSLVASCVVPAEPVPCGLIGQCLAVREVEVVVIRPSDIICILSRHAAKLQYTVLVPYQLLTSFGYDRQQRRRQEQELHCAWRKWNFTIASRPQLLKIVVCFWATWWLSIFEARQARSKVLFWVFSVWSNVYSLSWTLLYFSIDVVFLSLTVCHESQGAPADNWQGNADANADFRTTRDPPNK